MPKEKQVLSLDYPAVLCQYANEQGVSSDQLLNGTNISQDDLARKNAYTSIESFALLLKNCERYIDEKDLALNVGQRQHLATHGALGYAIMSCNEVEQVLIIASRYVKTRNRLIDFKWLRDGEDTVIQIDVDHPMDAVYQHLIEIAFSSMSFISTTLAQKTNNPWQLELRFNDPGYSTSYRELFGSTPKFNQAHNRLKFPTALLDSINLVGNPQFAEFAVKECEDLLQKLETKETLTEQVEVLLSQTPGYFPSQNEIANKLGTSSRSFARQLANENQSFRNILSRVRHTQAKQYLSQKNRSIEEISILLGYESPSNFTRAFKSWQDCSPQHFRQQLV